MSNSNEKGNILFLEKILKINIFWSRDQKKRIIKLVYTIKK